MRCIAPACGDKCIDCSSAISAKEEVIYAKRYAFLRGRDIYSIASGGVFAGMTPANVVLNGVDLDAAIDDAMRKQSNAQSKPPAESGSA